MDPVYWSILLVVLGFVVIGLELFIPSAGVLGVMAATLLVSGVITAFLDSFYAGVMMLVVTVVGLSILIALMIKVWPSTPLGRRILSDRMTADQVLPQGEAYTSIRELVGQLGIAKTKMLPSGIIIVNDRKYDAVSDGFAIEAGQPVKVTKVQANRIYVQPYEGEVADADDLPPRDRDVLSQSLEDLGIDDDLLS